MRLLVEVLLGACVLKGQGRYCPCHLIDALPHVSFGIIKYDSYMNLICIYLMVTRHCRSFSGRCLVTGHAGAVYSFGLD